jgi:hypothetical protein
LRTTSAVNSRPATTLTSLVTLAPLPRRSSASSAGATDTSAPTAPANVACGSSRSRRGWQSCKGMAHDSFRMHPHSTTPLYITVIPVDIVHFVSTAHCLLSPAFAMDCPHHLWLHHFPLGLDDPRPHHLYIVFRSCSLCVCLLPSVFFSRKCFFLAPPTIQPDPSLRCFIKCH